MVLKQFCLRYKHHSHTPAPYTYIDIFFYKAVSTKPIKLTVTWGALWCSLFLSCEMTWNQQCIFVYSLSHQICGDMRVCGIKSSNHIMFESLLLNFRFTIDSQYGGSISDQSCSSSEYNHIEASVYEVPIGSGPSAARPLSTMEYNDEPFGEFKGDRVVQMYGVSYPTIRSLFQVSSRSWISLVFILKHLLKNLFSPHIFSGRLVRASVSDKIDWGFDSLARWPKT